MKIQIERFEDCFKELDPLFVQHWQELGCYKDKRPLAPQYIEYIKRERSGILFLVVARHAGQIVGYLIVQVAPGFHYETTLTAHSDIAYVAPAFRNRGCAIWLFKCAQRELKRRGVRVWYSNFKIHNPLGMDRFLGAFGFAPEDVYLSKWIG